MLLNRSPEYWAREASLQELQTEVRKLVTWTEQAAEVLDFVYMERDIDGLRGNLAELRVGNRVGKVAR